MSATPTTNNSATNGSVSAAICSNCKQSLDSNDRFCTQCGQSTARIYWYSSVDNQPRAGCSAIPDGGTFYLVAQNTGNDAARVTIDVSRIRGLKLLGSNEAWVEKKQSIAFAMEHLKGHPVGGVVTMQTEDGERPRASLREPQAHWWEPRGMRSHQYRAQTIVRILHDRWVVGTPALVFPPGVRRQRIRIWNDCEQKRVFDTDIPAGYKILNGAIDVDSKAPEIAEAGTLELQAEAVSERVLQQPDTLWKAGPDDELITLHRMPVLQKEAGPDIIISIDFGTRNTGIRVRWRHQLVVGKARNLVEVISDKTFGGASRFPTEMAMHKTGRSFLWGAAVPRGMLPQDVVRITSLKTYLRAGVDHYTTENPQWTNAYLLERYFEQIFGCIGNYFTAVDNALQIANLNIRYVITRPVLDANEGDVLGKAYEAALLRALTRCGVCRDSIVFMHEPVAAAYGIAKRRRGELLACGEGATIAVADAGGGTTDIALAKISLRDGILALRICGTYALHLASGNPSLPAIVRFGSTERLELGGDMLDYALTHKLLTAANNLLETEGRPVPAALEVTGVSDAVEKRRKEAELVVSCRTMKESFAYVSTHHLTPPAGKQPRAHEHCIFPNRPEYEGIYLEQSLFGDNLLAPILKAPMEKLREKIESDSFKQDGCGVRASQVRQVFYVGGTNIEFYFRQLLHSAFPNSPSLQPESSEGVEERIAERLNAVVEGAVWCDDAMFASCPMDLYIELEGAEQLLISKGDPLPPETNATMRPILIRLEPFQEMNVALRARHASLTNATDGASLTLSKGFYRNNSETAEEGTLQVRISQEKGVYADLIINNRTLPQWQILLTDQVQG